MNFNNFTLKAQEAVTKAQEIAQAYQSPAIETDHLLKGIFSVDENVVPYLLKKMNVDLDAIKGGADTFNNMLWNNQVQASPQDWTLQYNARNYTAIVADTIGTMTIHNDPANGQANGSATDSPT